MTTPFPRDALAVIVAAHDYAPVFAALSGDHLYGLAHPATPFVVRGAHLLPLRDLLGLFPNIKTMLSSVDIDGVRIDIASHDLKKFLTLVSNKTGFVLEELWSPLVITAHPAFAELCELAQGALNRHQIYHHYRTASRRTWDRWHEWHEPVVLLRLVRQLLTATELLNTGSVECHLPTLAPDWPLLHKLITLHRHAQPVPVDALAELVAALPALDTALDTSYARSLLPDRALNLLELNEFLLRMRGA